jgi:LysM repeat protein
VETIKTAIVVVLLLAVLYGVYAVLSKPQLEPPPEVTWNDGAIEAPQVEIGIPPATSAATSATPAETAVPAPPALGIMRASEDTMPEPLEAPADLAITQPPTLVANESSEYPQEDQATDAEPTTMDAAPVEPVTPATAVEPIAAAQPADTDLASSNVASVPSRSSIYQSYANDSPPADTTSQTDSTYQTEGAFRSAWNSAIAQLEKEQWGDALLTLSLRYNDPDLDGEQRRRLVDLLDPLAGRVIYSDQSILEAPHVTKPGESLYDVARQYQVPVTLLQNINGISNPDAVWPGTSIKVVRGPFRAEIDLEQGKLVLFLGKYYAGRFAISTGNDPSPQPGEFEVVAKQPGREYITANGDRIEAGASDNPYGDWWIDLGQNMSIHGSPPTIPSHGSFGCVAMQPSEGADVYGILSVGSKVLIR